MGLLTNPNAGGGGLGALLRARATPVAWLCYLSGVAFLLGMSHPEYSHKTYFSENALLPGLVRGEFDEERATARSGQGLEQTSKGAM